MSHLSYEQQPSFPLTPAQTTASLRWLGHGLNLGGLLAPRLTRQQLWQLWFTPVRVRPNARAQALLATVEARNEVFSGAHKTTVYSWGQGPAVLLAHGWSGYGGQLGSFVQPLRDAGFRVLLFDAPGHAQQARSHYRLDQYAQLLEDIMENLGPVQAVIGHSLGATAAALALSRRAAPIPLAAVAASANLKTVLTGFQRRLGLSQASLGLLRQDLEAFFGTGVWQQYSLDHHLPRLPGPVLLVHDGDDAEAPHANAVYLRGLRADIRAISTQGLGHNRILHDAALIRQITHFVAAAAREVRV